MATLNVDTSIQDGDTVTAATLHSLIEDASVDGLVGSDFAPGSNLLVAQSTAPDPSEYAFWFDTRYIEGQVVRVYAAPWNIWLTIGPGRFEVPFQAVEPFRSGSLVVHSSGPSQCGIATGASINVLGFAQDTAASGAWIPICPCGLGWVAWASGTTDSGAVRNAALITRWNPAGTVSTPGGYNTAGGGGVPLPELAFGFLLDNTVEKSLGRYAIIWGPKEPRSLPL